MMHTYSALAPLYDKIMTHVEYDRWVEYIKKIIASYAGTKAPILFEIGGGTGLLGSKLLQEGMNYRGSDLSVEMCHEAKKRHVPFFVADARFLPLKKTATGLFDVIIFLYDGINYLQSTEEYVKTLREVHSCLRQGGLFLFDITTKANSLKNFNDFVDTGDFGDHFYFRHSYYQSIDSMQCNDFTIFTKTGNGASCVYRKFMEHHAQKVLPVTAIKEAVPADLFKIIGIWDDFLFRRYSSRSERVHFLLKRVT